MKEVLLKSFAYRSNLHSCNVVPLDKFRPTNLVKAFNFRNDLIKFHPQRVKCIDEKLIKGEELYHRRARRDPVTGVVPPTYSTADFRNSYSCLGMTSINPQNMVAFFSIKSTTGVMTVMNLESILTWRSTVVFYVHGMYL